MRCLKLALLGFLLAAAPLPVFAQATNNAATPYSGTIQIDTGKPFLPYVKALKSAITGNRMVLIGLACATCGAKAIGVDIPGNRVFLFFNPHYAVRMLKASEAAGIEAPIRIYVTEKSDATAKVTYRLPSHIFAPYGAPSLDALGNDLDAAVEKILADAAGATKP